MQRIRVFKVRGYRKLWSSHNHLCSAELAGAFEVTKAALYLVIVGSISYDSDVQVKYSQVRGPSDEATLRSLFTSRWS